MSWSTVNHCPAAWCWVYGNQQRGRRRSKGPAGQSKEMHSVRDVAQNTRIRTEQERKCNRCYSRCLCRQIPQSTEVLSCPCVPNGTKLIHMTGAVLGFPFCQSLPFPSKMPRRERKNTLQKFTLHLDTLDNSNSKMLVGEYMGVTQTNSAPASEEWFNIWLRKGLSEGVIQGPLNPLGHGDYFLMLWRIISQPNTDFAPWIHFKRDLGGAFTYLVPAGLVLQAEPQSWLLKWHKATSR